HVERVARSIRFDHAGDGARQLVFGGSGGRFSAPHAPVAAAVLYGPVADELSADLGGQAAAGGTRVAILQGWLRELEAGSAVRPRPLRGMAPQLCATLATLDALVASREDLAAEPGDADRQLDALRETFGARAALVLTDGPNGATLDAAGERWHLPAPARVEHGSTTGAGDMFAALLVAGGWPAAPGRPEVTERAEAAMRSVAEILRRRR
ncbi:MAG TPA: PfkB family carbohydrate kinase, partial [Candidatus Limnocylindria bacterium]|nr:PfkB family carbohydrate kinase [Candidatus Limnocylindria bacterium]